MKNSLSDRGCGIMSARLDQKLFLHVNTEFWGSVDVNEITDRPLFYKTIIFLIEYSIFIPIFY